MPGAGSSELAVRLQTHLAFLVSVCVNERGWLEMRESGRGERFADRGLRGSELLYRWGEKATN